uniref:Uncharacterized protein n=1 Tax=Opuntia streptacantha TaxID=393608 RepID=A0A7C9DS32_OPUST
MTPKPKKPPDPSQPPSPSFFLIFFHSSPLGLHSPSLNLANYASCETQFPITQPSTRLCLLGCLSSVPIITIGSASDDEKMAQPSALASIPNSLIPPVSLSLKLTAGSWPALSPNLYGRLSEWRFMVLITHNFGAVELILAKSIFLLALHARSGYYGFVSPGPNSPSGLGCILSPSEGAHVSTVQSVSTLVRSKVSTSLGGSILAAAHRLDPSAGHLRRLEPRSALGASWCIILNDVSGRGMGVGIAPCFIQAIRGPISVRFVRLWLFWYVRSIRFNLFRLLLFRLPQGCCRTICCSMTCQCKFTMVR